LRTSKRGPLISAIICKP